MKLKIPKIHEREIDLPDHLYRTWHALKHRFPDAVCDAQQMSEVTGRERAVESYYLNTLVTMGVVEKYREKRRVYFKLIKQEVGGE
jgi:hypothetical protein